MKNFEFLFCFILCVAPCVFAQDEKVNFTSQHEMVMMAKTIGITLHDLKECLDKHETDLDTMMELSSAMLNENTTVPAESIRKVGCFGACIYKKSGVLVNNKILPEKIIENLPKPAKRPEDIEFIRATFTKCSIPASTGTDECEIVLSFSRCVTDDMSKHF